MSACCYIQVKKMILWTNKLAVGMDSRLSLVVKLSQFTEFCYCVKTKIKIKENCCGLTLECIKE